ncbi:hypothetical protein FRC09_018026, partial [Ceratobasidium sp. 395]
MSPTALSTAPQDKSSVPVQALKQGVPPALAPLTGKSAILHRTPWHPPIATSAEGVYITLQNGTQIIDGVGGAA